MTPTSDLPEGCALVTGGAGGIGAACAELLAGVGWPVAITYRSGTRALVLADRLKEEGASATALVADVCIPDSVDAMFRELEARYGRVLVVVNNAGIREDGLVADTRGPGWENVLRTNLGGVYEVSRRAAPRMMRARFGRIINIGSVSAVRALPGQAAYAASKAGIEAFGRVAAVELARRGITVNTVLPGFIATDFIADVAPEMAALVPARRFGSPADVAACVRFLASQEAAYVNGATLTVDGGLSA